jgi:4a-hydroxytetrahydrobiopterin dehydratase
MTEAAKPLTRSEASAAAVELGWSYLLSTLVTAVPVASLTQAAELATAATEACGLGADAHLRLDLRPNRLDLRLQSLPIGAVTGVDVTLAGRINQAVSARGLTLAPAGNPAASLRPVQVFEVAIDALDIGAIRPFWKAVLDYDDEPGAPGAPDDALLDPVGQGPAVWFQQMDEPRPQRNRIHFDLTVPHELAPARVEAALAAGGVLVNDSYARSFWVLADPEGNEVCICTWQDRD